MKRAPGILPVMAVDRRSPRPLHRQIYEGYRDAIVAGRLPPGQRLPSTRALAAELRISRIPALTAFEQLLAEGYCECRVGAGSFVARSLPGPPSREGPARARPRPGPRPVSSASDFLLGRTPGPWVGRTGPFRASESAADFFPFTAWARLVRGPPPHPSPSLLCS